MRFQQGAGLIRRTATYIAGIVVVVAVVLGMPMPAHADEVIATLTATMTASGQSQDTSADFTDSAELIDAVEDLGDNDLVSAVTVDLKTDWNIDERMELKGKIAYTFNLHGHMINRGCHDASSYIVPDCIFTIRDVAEFTVNGGTDEEAATEHRGTLSYTVDDRGGYKSFWTPDEAGDTVIYGGVITGGHWVDGSAIWVNGGVNVQLNNVSIAGNTSCNYSAVHLRGDNATLNLNDAHLIYNRSKTAGGYTARGGALSITGDNCKVSLTHGSEISRNYSGKTGGGVYISGSGCTLLLDGASHIDDNYAGKSGGGVYAEDVDGNLIVRGASSISGNYAAANGGGVANIYFILKGAEHNFTVEVDGKGSAISNNEAGSEGGALYIEPASDVILSNGASVSNNRSGNGGGICIHVFDSTWPTPVWRKLTMTGGSSISGNTATDAGGAIYCIHGYGCGLSIESDSSSSVEGNSANTGGAIWFEGEFSLKGVNITGNTASSQGGGVYCTNTSYYTFLVGGTVNITDNTVNGTASNVVMKEDQDLNGMAGDDALTADSRIGVTCLGYNGTGKRKVSDNSKFLDLVGDSYKKVVLSDNLAYSVVEDAGLLYLSGEPTTFDVSVYTSSDEGAEPVKTISSAYGSTVILKAEDYKNGAGVEPDYWTIEFPSRTVTTSSGTAQIAIPRGDVKATAHYPATLTGVHVSLSDSSAWDQLGKVANVSVTSATLTASDGTEVALSEDAVSSVKVINVMGGGDDDTTKLIYIVQLPVSVAKKYGIAVPSVASDAGTADVHTAFGGVSAEAGDTVTAELAGGNIMLTIACVLSKPADEAHTVTVNCMDTNNASGAALHTFTVATDAYGNARVTAPQIAGWKFSHWTDPDGDKKTITVAGAVADVTLTCVYEPVLSDVWAELDELEVGEAFPGLTGSGYSRPAALSSGLDTASSVEWTNVDGSAVGEIAEGSTTYRATVTVTPVDTRGRTFSLEAMCDAEAGGNPESVSLSEDGKSFVVTYLVTSPADTSFDRVTTDLSTIDVEESSEAASYLPDGIDYLLKDGELKSAEVTWAPVPADVPAGSLFTVKGTFTDANGTEHEVERSFNVLKAVYTVDVQDGTAYGADGAELEDGCAAEGETVTVVAAEPEDGMEFDHWAISDSDVELADATSATTTFAMPAKSVKLQAVYKEKPDDKGDDKTDPQPVDPDDGKDNSGETPSGESSEASGDKSSTKKSAATIPATGDVSVVAGIITAAGAALAAVGTAIRRKR